MLAQRDLAHTLAGRREYRIAQRRHKRRNPGLSDPRRRSVAVDQVDVGALRCLGHAGNRVIVKIRLIDRAVGRRDFALRARLVPNTAAPSNWARAISGSVISPASTAVCTCGI